MTEERHSMNVDSADLLTPRQAAWMLGVRVTTIDRWARDGALEPVVRTPGGHRRFRRTDVLNFRAGRESPSAR